MKNSPIGFFDSGVGGLSVYARFKKLLPNEDTIYFGDLKNLPYGNKSQKELIGFAGNILDFFKSKGVKAVAIACNTSSALAYESVKDKYDFKIYPIIQSCAEVIASSGAKKIGVFATEGTVKSGAYARELQKHNFNIQVREIACPNWVSIVESGVLVENSENSAANLDVKNHIDEMMKFNPDKIILGCTHYPYLIPILTKFMPEDKFIDPAIIFAQYIKSDLEKNGLIESGNGAEEFYVSANPDEFYHNSQLFYKLKEKPQLVQTVMV